MVQRWIRHTDKVRQRIPESFPPFPDVADDSTGIIRRWLEMAQIEPLWAKAWLYKPGWVIGPRVVNDSFWFWFRKGQGWIEIGQFKQRFHFQSGDLVLVSCGMPHTIRGKGHYTSEVISVHFHYTLYPHIHLLALLGFPYVVRGGRGTPFGAVSEKLAREFGCQAPGWKQAMLGLIIDVLLYIIRHRGRYFRMPYGVLAAKSLPRLIPALEWVENHFHEPDMTIRDMTHTIGVSEIYSRMLFRQTLGISPVAYVRRYRIEKACGLLNSTQMSIKEVSARTGFSHAPFFSNVFHRMTGVLPSQYRASLATDESRF